jgi:hypothetical protein
MELESLKYIWHSMEPPPVLMHDREDLLALLQKKSQAPVARMRRNLIGEAILLLVGYIPAILCFLLGFGGRLAAVSWLFIVILAFFFAYYTFKYRLLGKMQCPTCHLRSNLARQIDTLKKYTRFYLLAGTGMIPLAYLISWFIVLWKLPSTVPPFILRLHPAPWWISPVFWLILLVPMTVIMYFANAGYINRLYGRHIKKLADLLHELDAE